ncbi:MAG: hypothetical protein OEL66_01310 [Desulfobulbaceae bacterium]|nr:hypothetical protein [Desulfobulbaceae bacterium]
MECDRLKRLVKNWYAQVQDETMAPARMVTFMRQHVADCAVCLSDPFVRPEIEKITALILPPEKPRDADDEDTSDEETEDKTTDEDDEVDDDDEDEDEDEDDDI